MYRHSYSNCDLAPDQSKRGWRWSVGSRNVGRVSEGLNREALRQKLGAQEETSPAESAQPGPTRSKMADETLYHNGYHHTRDNDDHDEVLLGQHIASVGSAQRDVSDAGRDLTAASADANRDLFSAVSDANRDLSSAQSEANRDLFSAVSDAQRDLVNQHANAEAHRDIIEQLGQNETTVVDIGARGRDVTFDQGSRGRETTLAVGAQIREDVADSRRDNLLQHCETQKLVIKEHCETREAVREEGVRTREAVREEARAVLERELRVVQESNSLLQLRLDILSGGGPGPLAR